MGFHKSLFLTGRVRSTHRPWCVERTLQLLASRNITRHEYADIP